MMRTPNQEEELKAYVGKRIKLEKFGETHEGVLKGKNPLAVAAPDLKSATQPWLLEDKEGTEWHFTADDGWSVTPL
jgi:hypothetical protein